MLREGVRDQKYCSAEIYFSVSKQASPEDSDAQNVHKKNEAQPSRPLPCLLIQH